MLEKPLTAKELRRLPAAERDAILSAAAAEAEAEYRSNPDLYVRQKIYVGHQQLDNGQSLSHEEVEQNLARWLR